MAVTLTQKEEEKLSIIYQTIQGTVTIAQAATMLSISPRQIKRLKKKVRTEGEAAVVHKLKGQQSNHHVDEAVKETALTIIQEQYADFKPTFATEKLLEIYDIEVSPETTRLWMIEKGLWKERKQKKPQYRSFRPRKQYYGELEQFDGSYH